MTLGDTLKNVANKVSSGGSSTGTANVCCSLTSSYEHADTFLQAGQPGVAGAAPGQAAGQQDMLDKGS